MLVEAINSVLSQTQQNFEIIIIDDCSTDRTEDLAKTFTDSRIKYFRNDRNRRPEYSRNFGFKHARGKYITFLDDDDYYTDYNFFTNAVKIFENHANDDIPLAFVCANAESLDLRTGKSKPSNIGKPGRVRGIDFILSREHKYNKPLSLFPTVFRHDVLRRAGFDDMTIFDTTTYLNAALYGDAWFMSDIIGTYRIHEESLTLGHKNMDFEYDKLYYSVMCENFRRYKILRGKLYDRANRRIVDRWYIRCISGLIDYHYAAKRLLKDRVKIVRYALREAEYMPKLLIMLPFVRLENFVRRQLRKITPLRKLYRAIKYRDYERV